MLQGGLIRFAGSGLYHLLPLGLRAMEKIIALIDKEMQVIDHVLHELTFKIRLQADEFRSQGTWGYSVSSAARTLL